MKKLFIFLNIILIFAVTGLIYLHASYESPAVDKELKIILKPKHNTVQKPFYTQKPLMQYNTELLESNNIFSSLRTENNDTGIKKEILKSGAFELTGLCRMGKIKGAVISTTLSGKSLSKFYRVNDKIVGTAYRLTKVSPDTGTVVVSNGAKTRKLRLDRNDSGSIRRRHTAVGEKQELSLISQGQKELQPETKKIKTGETKNNSVNEKRRRILEEMKKRHMQKKTKRNR